MKIRKLFSIEIRFWHFMLAALMLSYGDAFGQSAEFLIFNGELRGSDGQLSPDAKIRLVCGGKNEYLQFDTETGAFQMRIGVNRECEAILEQPGHSPTKIEISTYAPANLIGTEVAQMNELGVINLHKKDEKVSFEYKYKIAFDPEIEAFDYKENFQKATNRQKKEFAETVAAERRRELRKEQEVASAADSSRKAEEAAKEAARQAEIEAERQAIAKSKAEADSAEAARKAAELAAKREAEEREAREREAALTAKTEQDRKALEEKLAKEKAEREARLAAEQTKRDAEEKARQDALAKAEADRLVKEAADKAKREAEEKARQDAKAKQKPIV
jgi:hypothetical protein